MFFAAGSPISSISLNGNTFVDSNGLFSDEEFLKWFNLSNLDLKDFLGCEFKAIVRRQRSYLKLEETKKDDLTLVQCLCLNFCCCSMKMGCSVLGKSESSKYVRC